MKQTVSEERIEQRAKLLGDAGWRSALTIFCGELLARRGEVWGHIDLERRQIDVAAMLDDCGVLSGGEYRMVELALSLFNRERSVNLWHILAGLDESNGELAADAVFNFGAYCTGIPIRHKERILAVLAAKPARRAVEKEVQP